MLFSCFYENMLHEIKKYYKIMAMVFILYKYTPKVLVLTNYVLNIFKTLKYHLIFANYRLIASLDKKAAHPASQARQERPICSFLQSLATGCLVHVPSLA
jgi:hypothetical protein